MGWMNAQSVAGQASPLHPSFEGRASYFLVVNHLSKSSARVAQHLQAKAASAAAHLTVNGSRTGAIAIAKTTTW
jgi:hypothetical protein